jgi:uncharacterized protein YaeQ
MTWTRHNDDTVRRWVDLGAVPDDPATRWVACRMLLDLWQHHNTTRATLEQLCERLVKANE